MNQVTISIAIALVVLALLSAALATPSVRDKLIGNSNIRNALVPVAAAAVVWVTASVGNVFANRIEEAIAPADVLALRIQGVHFGLPEISKDYLTHDTTPDEIDEYVSELEAEDIKFQLTDAEFTGLQSIATGSGMMDTFERSTSMSTRKVAQLVKPALGFAFNYADWAKTIRQWSNYMVERDGKLTSPEIVLWLTKQLEEKNTSTGIFYAIVSMATRQSLAFDAPPESCASKDGLATIYVDQRDNDVFVVFPHFQMHLANSESSRERRARVNDLTRLFRQACTGPLAKVLREAADIFERESETMRRYVDEWNRILASKQPERLSIRVAISNVGRFDSFVRSDAKISVGNKNQSDKIELLASVTPRSGRGDADGASARHRDYIQVRSRSTEVLDFSAHLEPELQQRLYGAYESKLAYLALGVIASAGQLEEDVVSMPAQFSAAAEAAFKDEVKKIKIAF